MDTENFGTSKLLASLALEHIQECLFNADRISDLKSSIFSMLDSEGWQLNRKMEDREDVTVDFFDTSRDRNWRSGTGGPSRSGSRLPLLPALDNPKKEWRLTCRRIDGLLDERTDKVLNV